MAKTKHKKYRRVRHLPNVVIPEPGSEALSFAWQKGQTRKIVLELGCGKGEHSLYFATACPDRLFVGVDMKSHRLCDAGENALALGLDNLFFLRSDIRALDMYFDAGTVHEIWLTFPDPHPKQREIKHRLTSPEFMALYARLLAPGGRVHLKTDSRQLFAYTRQGVGYWGGRILCETQDLYGGDVHHLPVHGCRPILFNGQAQVHSAFEARAISRGLTITYLCFSLD